MHLCKPCEDLRDWATDPVVRTKIELNAQAHENLKARCGTCREYIRNPLFRTCSRCATRERICQHCGKTTLTAEEQARKAAAEAVDLAFERVVDDYTIVVKAAGIGSPAAAAFRALQDPETAEKLGWLYVSHLDARVAGRPLMAKLFGPRRIPDIVRLHCDRCVDERRPRVFAKAQNCGHFILGEHQAWCLHCALEQERCSTCGALFEHAHQETHLTPTE